MQKNESVFADFPELEAACERGERKFAASRLASRYFESLSQSELEQFIGELQVLRENLEAVDKNLRLLAKEHASRIEGITPDYSWIASWNLHQAADADLWHSCSP